MGTAQISSDLWQSGKNNGNPGINDSFEIGPHPGIQIARLIYDNKTIGQIADHFQILGTPAISGGGIII